MEDDLFVEFKPLNSAVAVTINGSVAIFHPSNRQDFDMIMQIATWFNGIHQVHLMTDTLYERFSEKLSQIWIGKAPNLTNVKVIMVM